MKILITGHKGFVGKHYVKYFNEHGPHEIVGVDIKEGNDCRDFFKQHNEQFDLIIHLAAIVGGREKIENEPLTVASDLAIDSDFFNWVLKTQQPKVIYFSSSAAYPIKLQTLELEHRLKESDININDIQSPDFTYGWSKLTGEYLANFVNKSKTSKVYVFRPFSGYGEDQDLDYPFPSFINRAINKADPFEIWGDGKQVRDFIHMDDVVEATMVVVEKDIREPLNLGCGIPTSFNDLAELVFKISGYRPIGGIKHLTSKPVGVMYRCCDPTKMFSIYTPKITLEQGIENGLKYFREHRT